MIAKEICELCGTPFADDAKHAAIGRKRFCSRRCQNRANYIARSSGVLEGMRKRYKTDEEYKEKKLQYNRDWREFRRQRTGKYRPKTERSF